MDFIGAHDYIVNRLKNELAKEFSYHSVDHTLDVLDACRRLARLENVNGNLLPLLETAALFHDAGILVRYKDHETSSVALAKDILPQFGYHPEEIDTIAGMILVTRLPQQATTLAEQILCDADLDYLGRDDFFIHSFQLQLEWKNLGILESTLEEWFKIQVKFLGDHRYYTTSANLLRNEKKDKTLGQITAMVKHQNPETGIY
jgi:predicted metal-dependent HD superfamily phosphohydrolase